MIWRACSNRGGPAVSCPSPSRDAVATSIPRGLRSSWAALAMKRRRVASMFLSDVTERKRIDATLRRFIANAAHELRSPLGMLVATASLLGEGQDTAGPPRLEQALQIIARQGERAQTLVTDLLDLSRYEHDISAELASVCLRPPAEEVMETRPARSDPWGLV